MRNSSAVLNVRQGELLQPRLRKVGNRPTGETHDAVSNSETNNSGSNFADSSDNILSENGGELVADEQARISATLIVGVEACFEEVSIDAMV